MGDGMTHPLIEKLKALEEKATASVGEHWRNSSRGMVGPRTVEESEYHDALVEAFPEIVALIEAQAGEIELLRDDAERYRWSDVARSDVARARKEQG